MSDMSPSTGRKMIKRYTIYLIVALTADKVPTYGSKARGRVTGLQAWRTLLSLRIFTIASRSFPSPAPGHVSQVSKSVILWKLSQTKPGATKYKQDIQDYEDNKNLENKETGPDLAACTNKQGCGAQRRRHARRTAPRS